MPIGLSLASYPMQPLQRFFGSCTIELQALFGVFLPGCSNATMNVGKAELLNTQFVSTFATEEVAGSIPAPAPGVAQLNHVECTSDTVFRLLATTKSNVATGPDESTD